MQVKRQYLHDIIDLVDDAELTRLHCLLREFVEDAKPAELNNVVVDIKTILAKKPAQIKRVGVFGSLVTGKMHENSDIDIAIEYDTGVNDENSGLENFIKFCEACNALSDEMKKMYKRKIDVVHVEERQGTFLDDIREEVVWI